MVKKKNFQKKLARLQKIRRDLEADSMFRAWQKFQAMPFSEQQKIRNEWDKYYQNVQHTNIYHIILKQKDADKTTIIELSRESRKMRENGLIPELAKPKSIDPWEFEHGAIVRTWRINKKQIEELVSSDDNAVDIFAFD